MSTTSMTSLEDHYPHSSNPDSTVRERNASPTYSSDHGRPIPRSANRNNHQGTNGKATKTHSRPDTAGSTVSKGPPRRTRTYSQSNTYDGPFQNGPAAGTNGPSNGLPTPGPSRSTSPLYQQQLQGRTSDVKPTRIPVVARGRTPSISSHGHSVHSGRAGDASRNGPQPSSPPVGAPPDLWAVEESEPWNHSHSTVSVSSRQRSGILNETAPFEASSISSAVSNQYKRGYSYEEPATTAVLPRTSTDSDERPFEHWYRGDVYRNGGVGELRVGGKQEMLDIANYGHRYGRSKPSKGSSTGIGISTIDDFPAQRKRADSVTAIGARESFYMDEERAKELANVLHEDPLTDMEGDIDLDTSNSYMDHGPNGPNSSTPAVLNGHRGTTPSIKQSLERERNAPETRIPGPAPRQLSEPPLSQIPTQSLHRGGSEPPPFPSSSSSSASVSGRPSVTQPSSTHLHSETQKRRAKSPAASVSKKLKTKPSKSSLRSKTQDEKNRRSVANYPEPPPGDDMMDAIPSWTQPVPAGGNWDEVSILGYLISTFWSLRSVCNQVVLPVVARKRGLDGHYEQADGATHSKKRPGSERIEPVCIL